MAVNAERLRQFGIPLAFFLLLSVALYGNTLLGNFVYDDVLFMTRLDMRTPAYLLRTWFEPTLQGVSGHPIYRPVTFATLALNYILFGESPVSFHAVSILLNGVTCWLVFLLTLQLFRDRKLAWMTAIFFALLPIHTEAVAYIKTRDELLIAFFGLLAWLAFLRATGPAASRRVLWSWLAAVASLLAFLSKESAMVLPALFAGTLFVLHGWRAVRKSWFPLLLQLAAMAAFLVLRGLAMGWGPPSSETLLYFGHSPLAYMEPRFVPWTAFELFFIAVSKTFIPWNLSAVYGFAHVPLIDGPFDSWMAPAGVMLVAILFALIAWQRTRKTPLGIGALTFLILYFPFSKILLVKDTELFGERWLYAPSIGLSLIGGYAAWRLWKQSWQAAGVLCAAVAVAYVLVLVPRNLVWRTETALGESMVQDAPNSVLSYTFLARDRLGNGRLDEAFDLVGEGLQITYEHVPLHQVAVTVALSMGKLDLAEQALVAAESLAHELGNDILRSMLLSDQGKYQESLDHLQASEGFTESDYRVRMMQAINLWKLGRHDEAELYFDWDTLLPVKMTREEKIMMMEM